MTYMVICISWCTSYINPCMFLPVPLFVDQLDYWSPRTSSLSLSSPSSSLSSRKIYWNVRVDHSVLSLSSISPLIPPLIPLIPLIPSVLPHDWVNLIRSSSSLSDCIYTIYINLNQGLLQVLYMFSALTVVSFCIGWVIGGDHEVSSANHSSSLVTVCGAHHNSRGCICPTAHTPHSRLCFSVGDPAMR